MPQASDNAQTATSNHAENFSLKDFFEVTGKTLTERVRPFSDYYRTQMDEGLLLYSRESQTPMDARIQVKDAASGKPHEMIMLGSNNYLGLANHPYVKDSVKRAIDEFGTGMGGPPLLNGMSRIHRELERRLAKLKGCEDAMLFASGFQANLGWVNGLLREGDVLLYDELNHASLYDGIRLAVANLGTEGGRSKLRTQRFRHNDCAHLERLLQATVAREGSPHRQIFVAVEGVYSMDGDLAPLDRIRELCDRYGANLVVDDAHGTAVMGETGGGTAEHFGIKGRIEIAMGTFSKAFGTTGGFLAGKAEVIHYLRFFSRSYMFSAHLPPPTVASVLAGLDMLEREPERLRKLHDNAEYLASGLRGLGYAAERQAAILPILVPAHVDMRALNRAFHEEGIFLNSVEYPAVPKDAQRLRISVMATHTREDLDQAIGVFAKLGRRFGMIADRVEPGLEVRSELTAAAPDPAVCSP